jgi:hypothetical protein
MSREGGRNRRRKYTKTIDEMRIEVMLSLFFPDCCRTPWGNGRTHDQLSAGNKRLTTFSFSIVTVYTLDFSIKYKL